MWLLHVDAAGSSARATILSLVSSHIPVVAAREPAKRRQMSRCPLVPPDQADRPPLGQIGNRNVGDARRFASRRPDRDAEARSHQRDDPFVVIGPMNHARPQIERGE